MINMKALKLITCLLLSICSSYHLFAQLGPSLAIGAGKAAYEKGKIDTELLVDIISERQLEVKSRLAENYILKNFENGNYASYNFINQSLQILFSNAGKEFVKKEILENVADYALVIGLSELFLRNLQYKSLNGHLSDADNALLEEYYKWLDDESKVLFQQDFNFPDKAANNNIKSTNQNINLFLLTKYGNATFKERYLSSSIPPQHILIDMVYDVCINSSVAKSIGFFSYSYSSAKYYKLSNFHKFSTKRDGWGNRKIFNAFKNKKSEVAAMIDVFFSGYNVVTRIAEMEMEEDNSMMSYFSGVQIDQKSDLSSFKKSFKDLTIFEDLDSIQSNLIRSLTVISNLEEGHLNKLVNINNLLYFIDQKIKPHYKEVDLTLKNSLSDSNMDIEGLENYLIEKSIPKLKEIGGLDSLYVIDDFITLFYYLNHLEEPETFDKLISMIQNAGNTYEFGRVGNILNTTLDLYDQYASYSPEEKIIKFDVEQVAVTLLDDYGNKNVSFVQPFFTLGINTGWIPQLDTAETNSEGLYYASEKVGIKFNFLNLYRMRLKNGKNEPLIKSVYLQTYASGLLYQVEALKSDNNFNSPTIGVGVGLSFFNNLDFSVSYAFPFSNYPQFINVGFDIPISDYLGRLNRKKKGD